MSAGALEKNLRILVVDDNRAVHDDFRKILCGGGGRARELTEAEDVLFGDSVKTPATPSFTVDSAFQGEEGLARARQAAAAGQPYAMAFIDVRMPPGWDGVETAVRIWEDCPDLQVVICTAYSDYSWNGMIARLKNHDQMLILKKPFDTMEVLQLANALTEKWRLLQGSRLKLEELEKLVQARTADLRQTNESLQTEIVVRQGAEARIREQARMLDLAHDAIHVRDLDGHVNYWNKSAERLYGWSAHEAIGARITELYCGDAASLARENKARLQVENGDWSGELGHLTKSGHPIVVHSRWTLVRDALGRPESILVIDTDVTEKKKLEAQLLQAQRMDSIGTLATGIAHDLNNILAPVLMIGPLLRAEIKDKGTLGLLDAMEAGAQRGADIVKQILTFARGVKSTTAPLQTYRLLKEFSGFIHETYPPNIVVNFVVPRELWLIEGNSTELHQVLVNLCLNAREAMPRGGTLTLSAANLTQEAAAVAIPNAKPGKYVIWSIADTGIGIAAKNLDRVFDPFFTTKEVGRGPGLGLSTALGIVHSYGGTIQLKSEPGRGTEVKIYLPVAASAGQTSVNSLPEAPLGSGELVLIIDGDAALGAVVEKVLSASGYRVLASADESEGVEIYRRHWRQVGAVLVDLMMPDIETALAALRKINPKVKLLASGTMGSGKVPPNLGIPDELLLRKPYKTSVLLETLEKALRGGKSPVPAAEKDDAAADLAMR